MTKEIRFPTLHILVRFFETKTNINKNSVIKIIDLLNDLDFFWKNASKNEFFISSNYAKKQFQYYNLILNDLKELDYLELISKGNNRFKISSEYNFTDRYSKFTDKFEIRIDDLVLFLKNPNNNLSHYLKLGDLSMLSLSDLESKRFSLLPNDEKSGRINTFMANIQKKHRHLIKVDGENIIEIDITAAAITMMSEICKDYITPEDKSNFDLLVQNGIYDLMSKELGFDIDVIKISIMRYMFSSNKGSEQFAIRDMLNSERKRWLKEFESKNSKYHTIEELEIAFTEYSEKEYNRYKGSKKAVSDFFKDNLPSFHEWMNGFKKQKTKTNNPSWKLYETLERTLTSDISKKLLEEYIYSVTLYDCFVVKESDLYKAKTVIDTILTSFSENLQTKVKKIAIEPKEEKEIEPIVTTKKEKEEVMEIMPIEETIYKIEKPKDITTINKPTINRKRQRSFKANYGSLDFKSENKKDKSDEEIWESIQ